MVGELLRTRPKTVTMLAILTISAGLTLGLAREALADYSFSRYAYCCGINVPIDSNGYVPEAPGAPLNGHSDRYVGYTSTGYGDGQTYDSIIYDWIEMRKCYSYSSTSNATLNYRLRAHERAHSRGWGHYETPKSRNAAYYPKIPGLYCP